MNLCSRLFVPALLIALLTPQAFSQKKLCAVAPPSPFKHDAQITTSLDRKAGGMRTTLQHPRPLGKSTEAVYMAASFVHQDPRRASAPTLDVVFYTSSPAARFKAGDGLAFISDGQARVSDRGVSYRSQTDSLGLIQESARVTLSYSDIAAITGARKVVARWGATEVELTRNHLESLRELVSLLAPSPSRWRSDESVSAR